MEDELLRGILSTYEGERGELIPILQQVQANYGHLPKKTMQHIALFIGIPESQVYSVASFYAQFRLTPLGKRRVAVCRGTACHIRGAPNILEATEKALGLREGETSDDLEYTLETVACIGCCALAPCVRVNEAVHGEVTPEKIRDIFPALNEGDQDVQ